MVVEIWEKLNVIGSSGSHCWIGKGPGAENKAADWLAPTSLARWAGDTPLRGALLLKKRPWPSAIVEAVAGGGAGAGGGKPTPRWGEGAFTALGDVGWSGG